MDLGFGFIPNLCGTPVAQPPSGGTTVIDLQTSVTQAVSKLQEILEELQTNTAVDQQQHSELISKIQELIETGQQPQVLPEDYSNILNEIRNALNELALTFPDLFGELALEVRGQIDRVVQRFVEQNTVVLKT